MTDAYTFDITCPLCGGGIQHITGSRGSSWQAKAVTECSGCGAQFVIAAELILHRHPNRKVFTGAVL